MNGVDAYIESLPEERIAVAHMIRELLITTVPGILKKFSFKIPFYHYHGMFCYITNSKEGINIGFCRGKDLTEAFPRLQLKKRAIVATLTITCKKDVETLQLREVITTAAIWNEEARKNKIPMVAKRKNPSPAKSKRGDH